MSFFLRPDAVKQENYVAKKPVDGSWRKRFEAVESWASSNPWDQIEKPSEKDIQLCITELFDAMNMNIEALRFIEKKCDENTNESPRLVIIETAKSVANILEGC